MKKSIIALSVLMGFSAGAVASEEFDAPIWDTGSSVDIVEPKAMADMSDPLAVYSQAGVGVTNRGLNLKLGNSYDTGSPTKLGMNVLEVKGIGGDTFGWSEDDNDSIDSLRYRNFEVEMDGGLGAQVDVTYDFNTGAGSASYSLMKALPAMGNFQMFPLAGAGLAVSDSGKSGVPVQGPGDNEITAPVNMGHLIPGAFGVVGMYSKYQVTDSFWLNWNPMYKTGLTGTIAGESTWTHEFAASYQIDPANNVRLFTEINSDTWTSSGNTWDHISDEHNIRLEWNHQF